MFRFILTVALSAVSTGQLAAQQPCVQLGAAVELERTDEVSEPKSEYTRKRPTPPEPKQAKSAKPPQPYKGTALHQTDFSYLEDPNNPEPYQPLDELKRIHVGDCIRFDLGGEYRNRIHVEDNMRLKGEYNDFDLNRTRIYLDLWYKERVRFYGEFLDAVSFGEDMAPRATDEDRSDFLNLFADAKLADLCGPVFARLGRQELFYGSERLVSSPDFSNVRRTYEGAKLFWKGEAWNVDAFWVEPVTPVDPHNFDSPDEERKFFGVFATYHATKEQSTDLYYLRLDEDDATNGFVDVITGAPGNYEANTFGARWIGKHCDWLWEFEGAVQFGHFAGGDLLAGMYTVGAGYEFECLPARPILWAYYDFASGDPDPTDNRRETFNQLFPSGHRYLGWMDLVGRQNIRDINVLLTAKPHERLELALWYHIFHLAEAEDNLYSSTGRVIRKSDPTGSDGTDVGQELDLTLTFGITPRASWLIGYSHFFAGDFISNSAAANGGSAGDADFFYSQIGVRF